MSKYVHVYLKDIDTQLAVVFIAKVSIESSDDFARLCSLTRAFATHIQSIKFMFSQPFSPCETCLI